MYRNILLAYDGSPDGCEALDQVAMLASMSGAAVRILAVIGCVACNAAVEGMSFLSENEDLNVQQMLDEAEKRLRRAGCAVTNDIKHGDPAEQIIVSAGESNADLTSLVIGIKERLRAG